MINKWVKPDVTKKDSLSTIGVDLIPFYLNFMDEPIKIKIWDTAGQERYAKLTESYIRKLDAVLLVFALNSDESFNQVYKWHKDIKEVK